MPYLLKDLTIDRVDLVDEGANSAAFIELYKRKGLSETMDVQEILSKMKPEHSEVIQTAISKAEADLAAANENLTNVTAARDTATEELEKVRAERDGLQAELDVLKAQSKDGDSCSCDGEADEGGMCKACGKPKMKKAAGDGASFDEKEVMKSMPENVRKMFDTLRTQKEAAEESLRKAKEAELTAEAVAKAAALKALPIAQDKLVDLVKSASTEMLELLTATNAALEGVVLDEVGKSNAGNTTGDAWAKIEAKADEVAKTSNITKAKAISQVIRDNPDLYKEYLQGGAN